MLPIWGGELDKASNRQGEMVQRGSLTPYKLSGIVGSLPGSTMFCQIQQWCDHSDETGQCHNSDIHKQVGGNTLTPTLSACSNHMGLEHIEKHLPTGRTSAREGQSNGRSGIKIKEGLLRLDAESSGVQPNPAPDGATRIDLFASRLTKQIPQFYSWRPDPEAQGTDAFNQDWLKMRGFANPLWCLIGRCLSQVKRLVARIVIITPL